MRLVIVSHTAHYLDNGVVKGWGATVREIDYLATLFDEIIHIAPLHRGHLPSSSISYEAQNVRLVAVRPTGGKRLWHKLSILARIPKYIAVCLKQFRYADIVHIRCPANISLIAVILTMLVRHPRMRWIKYAGNWKPNKPDAWSYRFQRWLLKKGWHRGVVTVNGEWPDSPSFVHSFINPCLTQEQLAQGKEVAKSKHLSSPLRIVFVGRTDTAKGIGRIIQIAHRLHETNQDFLIDVIGDGPERPKFEADVERLGLNANFTFHGWLARDEIDRYYNYAHFILLPSNSEGWPKVLSEAMSYGVVPVASAVGSIPYYLRTAQAGQAFPADDVDQFVKALKSYRDNLEKWKKESQRGVQFAEQFGYESYLEDVKRLLELS